MLSENHIKVVICWHMHQPEYRDLISGEYQLPWTYLHAIKDYVDMAVLLEEIPGARAVVNFAPVLLDQIADYAEQVQGFLTENGPIRDPLLAALNMPALPVVSEERTALIKNCLRANEERLINRFEPYRRLADMAAWLEERPDTMGYISWQYPVDLLVWYHLAWMGETVRRNDERVKRLIKKGTDFTLHDRRELLTVIGELLSSVIPRYRALAERGQVELSMTPYAHPITPLLLDLDSAAEAMPDLRRPLLSSYPGGAERARWHIREGIATFQRHFGLMPQGCWPAEGGISTATAELFGEYGFNWTASGETVFRNSRARLEAEGASSENVRLHQPHRIGGDNGIPCFFRDDGLSDLIGFTYSNWHSDDAVNDFVSHLKNIAAHRNHTPGGVVSVILDGENAWEHYPDNGYPFLKALYRALADHPDIDLTTFSGSLSEGVELQQLPSLVAGSWVYGTFSTDRKSVV